MRFGTSTLLILGAAGLLGQPLSQGDRDYAASQLHATRKLFLDTVASVSDRQWSFKPAPEVWSLAEVAEHLAVSEERLFQLATVVSLKTPVDEEKKRTLSTRAKDEAVVKNVPVRDQKFQAPEMLKPSGRFKTRDEVVSAFRTKRDSGIAYILSTPDELRGRFTPHPALGDLDSYQWLLMMSAHTERHVNQMKEVMARADFPAK